MVNITVINYDCKVIISINLIKGLLLRGTNQETKPTGEGTYRGAAGSIRMSTKGYDSHVTWNILFSHTHSQDKRKSVTQYLNIKK